ncbi:uncharacterized protein TEOVI_000689900 [Trypanosoma equiperdum]|uniref:Cilia- and flagella-associated protein 53 n=4 Tax=Trypanozoon TaxID=39700 RepID=Q57VE0_TRYB2|nr:T. brucei spp.-specific protein [Trypanosoma brucei gambiense DAL972]XP_844797.1 hypothetical protein, conserved [Trypanosoma brucei brucei TREU927]AAX70466.1 hypothetical protein, conserved [Trypanosoma brucei]RHW72470.1 hypothetical protein DPX39_050018400 [Trypanosoma brucei equiperdum]SCU67427.1 hypothetical protein, conserved [Trypanosoma equiperdum]AAZ11238.1 hypothetical protein, conserved [Trypanosoma brucei brucei TREU927]CBH11032.1 T. brucei spp.-specific protein [Trypanosoma bru|eukprot:XP_011773319.1 T. brucei spp.-specific protein [Trypanosoma brucei gambiense DAL972]
MAHVAIRRQREEEQRAREQAQAVEKRMRLAANFETRSEKVYEQKDLMRRLDLVRAKHDDALVARRQRLAAMLLREKEEHEAMLNNLTETDEQRRDRLIRKARELRAQQQHHLRVDAQKRHERLFREKIDCLRLAESRLRVMQVANARFEQLALAERRKEEQQREEEFFAQQRVEENRLANERAQKDLEEDYIRKQAVVKALAAQVEGNKMRAEQHQLEVKKENEAFCRAVEEERAAEAQKKMEARIARAALAKEMSEFNEQLRTARRQEYERLQKEDREVLDRMLAELAEQEQEEKRRKHELRANARLHLKEVERQMNQRKEDMENLDKLWEEENNKVWEKREAHWRADEEKRRKLLRNVLIVRRQQVLDKRQQEKEAVERAEVERQEFRNMIAGLADIDAMERAQRFAVAKENQKYLESQVQRRNAEKEEVRMAMKTALTAEQEKEKVHAERIKREIENLERAKPERYKDVPLLPRQRFPPI